MSTSAVSSTSSTSATATAAATSSMSSLSGQTDFLKILIAQLANQNPLDGNSANPQDFIAQLAQFQSLSATLSLNKSFEAFSLSSELMQGTSLIGKTVDYTDNCDQAQQGVVSSVKIDSGVCKVLIDETLVELSSITGVSSNDSAS
ncbi:MAG: flagellar hook capping FlgD N-terminal domain-containing protein [Candidatus Xenobiia bacterium LiM19]